MTTICRRLFLLFAVAFFLTLNTFAQSDSIYQALIARAGLFHLQGNYISAIDLYRKAFEIQQPDALTAYKAAGVYSLDSKAGEAFKHLDMALSSGWTEADWLAFDPYFNYLREAHPEKWKAIESQAFLKERQYVKDLQLPSLRHEINLMTLNDQKLRYQRVQNASDSLNRVIDEQINQSDRANLNRAKEIIQRYGWPKISQIGKDGQNNLWLIIQHADQDVLFQQSALLAMQKLNGTKDSNPKNYAFLYDRVQCNLNYKQLYGTQVVWTSNGEASAFRPILLEYMVDDRRKKLGLQPLQIYALTYGFTYRKVTRIESEQNDKQYIARIRSLLDSAKHFYEVKEFSKTYDYYNTASTFIGGMSNADNFEAATIFSRIAAMDKDDKYKGIALDFLDLLRLRGVLTKPKLMGQPAAFKILYKDPRWIAINEYLSK